MASASELKSDLYLNALVTKTAGHDLMGQGSRTEAPCKALQELSGPEAAKGRNVGSPYSKEALEANISSDKGIAG